VAVRSVVQVCSRFIGGNTVSNPAEGMAVRLLCLLCVGRGLCYELITRSDELYRVCMSNCV
jgi:hypothetical protein